MRNAIGIVLATLLFGAGALADQKETAERRERLNPKIGRADRQKYRSIRDGKGWANPALVIRANGIEVIAKGLPSGRIVAPSELRRTLVNLPVNAWPYGRVVSAQNIGIRSSDQSDEEPIRQNREAAETVLKELDVDVDWFPSA